MAQTAVHASDTDAVPPAAVGPAAAVELRAAVEGIPAKCPGVGDGIASIGSG